MIQKKNTILFLLLIFALEVYAGGPGTTSGNFLKIPVAARPAAMGGSFSAIADDASTIVYNPAGLLNLERTEFSAMHLEWFQDIRYQNLAITHRFNKTPVGVNISHLYSGGIQRTIIDEDGQHGFIEKEKYSVGNKSLLAATAGELTDSLNWGLSIRYLEERLYEYTAHAVSMNMGLLYNLNDNVRLSLVMNNLGTSMRFIKKREVLPIIIKSGVGVNLFEDKLKIGFEIEKPFDNQPLFKLGCEWTLWNLLSLRAGYRHRWDGKQYVGEEGLANLFGLSAGIGVRVYKYNFDYAFVPFGDLGYVHYFTIGGRFK